MGSCVADFLTIDIELGGTSEALERVGAALSDPSPLMAEIAQHLEFSTQRRFETETDPEGKPWKPSKRAQREGGKTLQQSRTLLRAVRAESGRDYAAVGVGREGGAGVYAAIHQFGGTIENAFGQNRIVVMPKRAYLGFSESDRVETTEIITDYLKRALGQ